MDRIYNEQVEQLIKAAKAYYVFDNPIMTDEEYDELYHKVKLLEEGIKHKHPDSPVNRVGGVVLNKFEKEKHINKMYSMEDVFNHDELDKWLSKFDKSDTFYLTGKLDGASLNLKYTNGELVSAITRGDGVTGEVVTHNAEVILSIPKVIKYKNDIEIRGEVVIFKKSFEAINSERLKNKEPLFANPRNAASGSLRQLDNSIAKKRKLMFIPWGIGNGKSNFKTMDEEYKFFANNGFVTNPFRKFISRDEVKSKVIELGEKKDEFDMMLDGCVISLNDNGDAMRLGYTSKYPKFMVAYKYPAVEKVTKLIDVKYQIGRTGVHTPVGVLEPVLIDGSTVSRVTLHNIDYITGLDLKINDQVTLIKSGDIIPKITKVFTDRRDGNEYDIPIPTSCISCESHLEKIGPNLICVNNSCPSKLLGKLVHFCSRDVGNLDGLNEKTLQVLVDNKLVKDVVDLYRLKYDDLITLDGFQDLLIVR